jgi:copper(I)-binding protein
MSARPWIQQIRFAPSIWGAAIVLLAMAAASGLGSTAFGQSMPAGTAGSYKVGSLVISGPWVRATPPGAKTAAAYLKITNNGTEADRLVGGTIPLANALEVHEMSMSGGVMKMRKLDGLEIAPGKTIELAPGGYHIMLLGLHESVKEGKPIKGTLRFEKAGTVDVEYVVAPIGAQGGHMKH